MKRARLLALATLFGVALLLVPSSHATPSTREVSILVHIDAAAAPFTLADGVRPLETATTTGGAFNRMQTAMLARQATGTPWAVILSATISADAITATSRWIPTGSPGPTGTTHHLYVIEDAPPGEGTPRFVVRATMNTSTNGSVTSATTSWDPHWNAAHVGVVALAVSAESNSTRFALGEVLQSAVWLSSQDAPTEQVRKAVLLEHTTGPDCEACSPGDEALALLASQYGFPVASESKASYQVGFPPLAWAGLAVGAAVGLTLARWRP